MPSFNISAPVFPQLGETRPQASRIDPEGLSPFAAFIQPVPPPSITKGSDFFPDLQQVMLMREMEEMAQEEEDESDLERRRQEAAELGFKQGHAEGFRKGTVEGYDLGREQGLKEAYETVIGEQREVIEQFNAALQTVVDQANAKIAAWFEEREIAMSEVALEAVRRLLSSELATSRQSALAMTQDALAEITHANHIRIRVNPFDVPILEQHRSLLLSSIATLRDIELVPDGTITAGCVVESEGGVVDTRLEVRQAALEKAWQSAA